MTLKFDRRMPAARPVSSSAAISAINRGDAKVSKAWYRTLLSLRIVNVVPPTEATILFASRIAPASPSTPKGTPDKLGTAFRTNVIPGCTDATFAPLSRSAASTSLVSAPLEWKTILPCQSGARASLAATLAITSSGTVIHTSPEESGSWPNDTTLAFVRRARRLTSRDICSRDRTTRFLTFHPACRRLSATAMPRRPGPTILISGRSPCAARMAAE